MNIKFLEESSISDIDYFKQIFNDLDRFHVSVRWGFDEQQADPFHRNFSSHEFFRRLKRLVASVNEN